MFRPLYPILLMLVANLVAAQTPPATTVPNPSRPDSKSLIPVKNVLPEYPAAARDSNRQGLVVIKIAVNGTGEVETADVISGDPELARAAVDSVKYWRFEPFIKNGKPEKVSANVNFNFAITDGRCSNGVKQATVSTPFEHRVTVSEKDMTGLICKKVTPAYPSMAALARVQGSVLMSAVIGKDGTVGNLRLLSTASPLLVQAAFDAVKQWRYKPYLVAGEPVEVETTITVMFAL